MTHYPSRRCVRGFRSTCLSSRRAAASLEFALVFPVLLLVILGVIEFSRAFLTEHMLTLATREAARLASLEGSTVEEVRAVLHSYLTPGRVDTEAINVEIDPANLAEMETGDWITVSVSVRFEDVSLLSTPFFLAGRVMRSECTMRRE
jgi:Flp pilus assembly protein TadG